MTYYRIAGKSIGFDRSISWLGTAIHQPEGSPTGSEHQAHLKKLTASAAISAEGLLDNGRVTVTLCVVEQGYRMDIPDRGSWIIAADGSSIKLLNEPPPAEADWIAEVMVGAPLVFALALQGVYCLHASALALHGRGVAFTGESGFGKSTLAQALSSTGGGWQRIADDILPVTVRSCQLAGWTHFPQLKLPLAERMGTHLAESVPLEVVLQVIPTVSQQPVRLEAMSRDDGVRLLLANTAGARLFIPDQLQDHLRFCSQAAACTKFYRLFYPHRWDVFPEILATLSQWVI